jgi:uncharacterized protein YgbK (DUF1537 family)
MIGVVADDLTGAAELGGIGWRFGLVSEILLRAGKPGPWARLVCMDTDSRSSTPDEAGRRAAVAARRLRARRAKWLYKKTDSVLRGNVAAELSAILRALGMKRALLVPANPGLGRVIRQGRYCVHGTPLHQTEFARDPEHPRTSSSVLALLKSHPSFPVYSRKPGDPLPTAGLIVGDAHNRRDLIEWAAQSLPALLPAGGAEFFAALLATENRRPRPARKQQLIVPKSERVVFVCGSASESARRLIANARRHGMPVLSLARVLADDGRIAPNRLNAAVREAMILLRQSRSLLLHIGLPPAGEPPAPKPLASRLARFAAAILQRVGVGAVFAEGGATSLALARRMRWSRLTVLRELAPGVVTLGTGPRRRLRLTIKPGSYVWPPAVQALLRSRHHTTATSCDGPHT